MSTASTNMATELLHEQAVTVFFLSVAFRCGGISARASFVQDCALLKASYTINNLSYALSRRHRALEVLESVSAKRGLGLRRELVTPSVRTQQCSLSHVVRGSANVQLAPCEQLWRFAIGGSKHESSSP